MDSPLLYRDLALDTRLEEVDSIILLALPRYSPHPAAEVRRGSGGLAQTPILRIAYCQTSP